MSADISDPKSAAGAAASTTQSLPKLTPQQFRTYNHMAEHMNAFHEHFRQTWNLIYTAASTHKKPPGTSIRQFLNMIQQFVSQLTTHHTIEERYIFPVLAAKMERFDGAARGELVEQHKAIHHGLEDLSRWVEDVKGGEKAVEWEALKGVMDGFGKGLWDHLDAEVAELGAENMRLFWTEEEMRSMPM